MDIQLNFKIARPKLLSTPRKGVNRAKIRYGSFPNRHNLNFERKQTQTKTYFHEIFFKIDLCFLWKYDILRVIIYFDLKYAQILMVIMMKISFLAVRCIYIYQFIKHLNNYTSFQIESFSQFWSNSFTFWLIYLQISK